MEKARAMERGPSSRWASEVRTALVRATRREPRPQPIPGVLGCGPRSLSRSSESGGVTQRHEPSEAHAISPSPRGWGGGVIGCCSLIQLRD